MIGENFEITGASSGLCPQSGHKPACEEGFTPLLRTSPNVTRSYQNMGQLADKAKKPNKDKFIKIRFQDEEREELFEAAKKRGMKLSDLIRNAVCGYIGRTQTKIKPAMNIVAVPDKVIIAVNKIGTNVNQLARSVNTAIKYGENFDAIAIQATLFEVLFALYQIIESLKTERKMSND